MQIIDFRCRPPFDTLAKDWIFSLDDKPGNPGLRSKYQKMGMELPASLVERSMDAFLEECDQAGICRTVVPLRRLSTQNNDHLGALLRAYPDRFIGFAGVQPLEEGIAEALEQILLHVIDGPCSGVYMEPGLDPHPWAVDDAGIFPIYEFCQHHDLPVCLLYGGVLHKKIPPATTSTSRAASSAWPGTSRTCASCFRTPAGLSPRWPAAWPSTGKMSGCPRTAS